MSSDQIAYLRDLANSYFQEGNLSAAVSTWEQVLSMDPANLEARQGITLAQMKLQGIAPPTSGGGQDPDATMMFQVGDQGGFGIPPAPPPAPGGGFDAERTMIFGGAPAPPSPAPAAPAGNFDAERTMIFGGAPAPPAAPGPFASPSPGPFAVPPAPEAPAAGGFDAERTMLFGQSPMAPAAAPPAPPSSPAMPAGFDADRTMAFNPSLAPPPAPAPAAPAPSPAPSMDWLKPAAAPVPDADSTMMSPPVTPDFGFALPPPASPFSPPSGATPPPGSKPLESFALPSAPPAFTPPPGMGGGPAPSLPPPPGGSTGGFSFELPPPPGKGGGMPDLPSVGFSSPPPVFTPAPPPPPAMPGTQKKGSGQFGEVDPGEIESLAVPTVAPSAPPADDATRKAREDQLKKDYEQQYGRTTVPSQHPPVSRPSGPSRPAVSPKFLVGLLIVLAVVLGGGYLAVRWYVTTTTPPPPPPKPSVDENAGLDKAAAEAKINQKLAEYDKAVRDGKLLDAERALKEATDIALKNEIELPVLLLTAKDALEREKQYQTEFQKAVKSFCVEDYPKANFALLELEKQFPEKKEPGEYVERIFWNLGIEKLQQMEPWEATYYLENLVQRNAGDKEAAEMLAYAQAFSPGSELGDAYLRKVDPLSTRMAGCN